uniref:Putative ovule protein n=1 Tax=Solanum chacoense TaxID=4108 RepID=A0A0V0GZX8_SOLCH
MEDSFLEVIQNNWNADFEGDPFSLFHHKLKKVKKALTQWSKMTFKNIFQEIATLEEVIKVHEAQFELIPSANNRAKLHKAQGI